MNLFGKCNYYFNIQIFGINEKRETFSLLIDDFKPYFYIKIPNKFKWNKNDKNEFVEYIKLLLVNITK